MNHRSDELGSGSARGLGRGLGEFLAFCAPSLKVEPWECISQDLLETLFAAEGDLAVYSIATNLVVFSKCRTKGGISECGR